MTTYESIFIVRPTLSDEEVAKIIEKIRGMIEKRGGAVVKTENWGKKKLAYEVKKEKKGTYLLFRFKGDGKVVAELERHWQVEDALIKFLTLKAPASGGESGRDRTAQVPSSSPPLSAGSASGGAFGGKGSVESEG